VAPSADPGESVRQRWISSAFPDVAESERRAPQNESAATPFDQVRRENELRLRELDQFFNSIEPSPFHEKDLDHDVEEFIVSWATEHPLHEPLRLIVHLVMEVPGTNAQQVIEQAVQNYFACKAEHKPARHHWRRQRLPKIPTPATPQQRSLTAGKSIARHCCIQQPTLNPTTEKHCRPRNRRRRKC
jgi:hypothetical protein